ncbi:MAG: serine/threonine protein kinase [Clostridia bacterium]|nr:serine/threonine protein kinase [Clostridia bacterium]
MLEIGSVLDGKYKILSEIGHGGMSVVYMALNEKANKTWAVKEIRKDGKMDFNIVRQGLVAEIETLKKLNHPNLPSIVDVIEDQDSFIIVMDYIEGNSLDKALLEHGAQPQDNVIEWAMQLCDVLGYLHSCNPPIIYRDMKPANIMLKPDGNIALIDFGTAKTYEIDLGETTGIGTIGYAAPEQFIGSGLGRTDARTDIYCLGITLYHLLTGIDPCKNVIADKSIRAVNPTLSQGLDEIIIKCTQPDPKDRYQSCDELLYAFEHHNEMGIAYRKMQKKKLKRFIATAAATIISAFVAVFGFVSAENAKTADYEKLLGEAENIVLDIKSETFKEDFKKKCDKFVEAIATSPERYDAENENDAYNKMIKLFESEISDKGTELSTTEAKYISQLETGYDVVDAFGNSTTIYPIEELKTVNTDNYEELCLDIGILYWYSYEVQESRYEYGGKWFGYIAEENSMAMTFKEIADITEKIRALRATSKKNIENLLKIKKEIPELWNKIKGLYDNASDYDEDMKIIALREVISCISSEVDSFIALENVTKEQIVDMLNGAKAGIDSYGEDAFSELSKQADEAIKRAVSVKENGKEAMQ